MSYRAGLADSGSNCRRFSLGPGHNFGGDHRTKLQARLCRTRFDLAITHFDLANNFGPPPGSAETLRAEILERTIPWACE